MKICTEHWESLRTAIKSKGMWHLVAASGEQLVGRLEKELKDEAAIEDPLMAANMMIWSRAIKLGGIYLMGQKEDGSAYCPLCELDYHADPKDPNLKDGEKPSENWIEGCTEALRKENQAKGLI